MKVERAINLAEKHLRKRDEGQAGRWQPEIRPRGGAQCFCVEVAQAFIQYLTDGRPNVCEERREALDRFVEITKRDLGRQIVGLAVDLIAKVEKLADALALVWELLDVGLDERLDTNRRIELKIRIDPAVERRKGQQGTPIAHPQVAQKIIVELSLRSLTGHMDRRIKDVGAAAKRAGIAARGSLTLDDQDLHAFFG